MHYTLHKTRRAKHLRLTVRHDGTVHVSAPLRVSARFVDTFVIGKQEWILRAQKKLARAGIEKPWQGTRAEYLAHKAAALRLVTERLAVLNELYDAVWKKVTIRNQRSRWGSCSRSKHLSFNYRIVFLAPELQNYLLVHELCHLLQMNHSPQFWQLVAVASPNYRALRRQLKTQIL